MILSNGLNVEPKLISGKLFSENSAPPNNNVKSPIYWPTSFSSSVNVTVNGKVSSPFVIVNVNSVPIVPLPFATAEFGSVFSNAAQKKPVSDVCLNPIE